MRFLSSFQDVPRVFCIDLFTRYATQSLLPASFQGWSTWLPFQGLTRPDQTSQSFSFSAKSSNFRRFCSFRGVDRIRIWGFLSMADRIRNSSVFYRDSTGCGNHLKKYPFWPITVDSSGAMLKFISFQRFPLMEAKQLALFPFTWNPSHTYYKRVGGGWCWRCCMSWFTAQTWHWKVNRATWSCWFSSTALYMNLGSHQGWVRQNQMPWGERSIYCSVASNGFQSHTSFWSN